MKIQLERLPHQVEAINAINKAFYGVDTATNNPDANYIYANPILRYGDSENKEKSYIDVKMETGTGKTFVYTQMMYEMHKQGVFKFVIVVPTPSIKEGTRNFITSDYARQYFSGIPGYENVSIQLNAINAGDFSNKKGRRNFPAQLSEFIEATRQNVNQIQVLLINAGMVNSKSMTRDDYDQTLLGGQTSPIKAIAATRPVIIIDEPHRFPRNKVTYKAIERMKPQLIVRFGATFPQTTTGRGKNKKTVTDYYRGKPQFNLNAIDSFNQGLVKAIDINYPDITEQEASRLYKVKNVGNQLTLSRGGKEYTLNKGENLANIDEDFAGDITYVGSKELSNGLELKTGMKLIPGTFAQSYQDEIITQAIERHFEAEERNFMRPESEGTAPRVKTLSLFFIDSIASFRGPDHTKGWLAQHFEEILMEKLNQLIKNYETKSESRKKEYYEFLKATVRDLKAEKQQVYAGYFSEDRGTGDEAIQTEVNDILKNKERLLSFKDKDGNWITRRFLFSKWTLREGWDNPNVFVIAKLRTSGSEISKIQEVGRGLRLPVDETGHRLQQDEFESRLSFLIGYDERDFAENLVKEVNDDAPIEMNKLELTQDMVDLIVKERQKTDNSFIADKLLEDLGNRGIINFSHKFTDKVELNKKEMSGYDALVELYPELEHISKVADGKIRDKNSKVATKVKLRKSNWKQLEDLWKELSRRRMIKFDDSVNDLAQNVAKKTFNDNNIFVLQQPQMITQKVVTDDKQMLFQETQVDYKGTYLTMKYGAFLKQLTTRTNLPVDFLHRQMIASIKRLKGNKNYINEKTLGNLVREFNKRFNKEIRDSYSYVPLQFTSPTSIYDSKKQKFIDEISANDLGVYNDEYSTEDDKYLYDRPPLRYDSANPELKILKRTYDDNIIVFGKLPKRAIKIPRYDNGTTTPDFIFKIECEGKTIYLMVETKAENMRLGDQRIELIQKKYFDELKDSGVYYGFATSDQEVHDLINKLENGEIKESDFTN
ncbi:type III restriction-modification system endonuclease [Lactobacillus agilis]|uniref:Type III restriction-modification system endonuclease n=1 Tax=Ligilactobacillus agilis TaxID=1601 RepID=A0A848C260_9LACO|nr:type III restriction-modification system endonuclease [Ligilactobacillus agilis]NME41725.1 type III restriction-modification system endonuclease [Ligilactobacillus agilis]